MEYTISDIYVTKDGQRHVWPPHNYEVSGIAENIPLAFHKVCELRTTSAVIVSAIAIAIAIAIATASASATATASSFVSDSWFA